MRSSRGSTTLQYMHYVLILVLHEDNSSSIAFHPTLLDYEHSMYIIRLCFLFSSPFVSVQLSFHSSCIPEPSCDQ